jgi:hypothetical protein
VGDGATGVCGVGLAALFGCGAALHAESRSRPKRRKDRRSG